MVPFHTQIFSSDVVIFIFSILPYPVDLDQVNRTCKFDEAGLAQVKTLSAGKLHYLERRKEATTNR